MLRRYGNLSESLPESAAEAFAAGIKPTFQQFVTYLLDPETERGRVFNEHWRQVFVSDKQCKAANTVWADGRFGVINALKQWSCVIKWIGFKSCSCVSGVPSVPSVSDQVWLHWTTRNPGNWCRGPAETSAGGWFCPLSSGASKPHRNELGKRLVCADSCHSKERTVQAVWTRL